VRYQGVRNGIEEKASLNRRILMESLLREEEGFFLGVFNLRNEGHTQDEAMCGYDTCIWQTCLITDYCELGDTCVGETCEESIFVPQRLALVRIA